MPLQEEVNKTWTIARIATAIGIITGLITIIVFSTAVLDTLGKYVVTNAELEATEARVVAKIHNEALIIRQVYIDELLAQKTRLADALSDAKTDVEFEQLKYKIDTIEARIDSPEDDAVVSVMETGLSQLEADDVSLILRSGVDASTAEQKCVVYVRDCEVRASDLGWITDITEVQKATAITALETAGIILR